jgi:hypothetical protein
MIKAGQSSLLQQNKQQQPQHSFSKITASSLASSVVVSSSGSDDVIPSSVSSSSTSSESSSSSSSSSSNKNTQQQQQQHADTGMGSILDGFQWMTILKAPLSGGDDDAFDNSFGSLDHHSNPVSQLMLSPRRQTTTTTTTTNIQQQQHQSNHREGRSIIDGGYYSRSHNNGGNNNNYRRSRSESPTSTIMGRNTAAGVGVYQRNSLGGIDGNNKIGGSSTHGTAKGLEYDLKNARDALVGSISAVINFLRSSGVPKPS